MPTGIYKRTTNKGWFKKGHASFFKDGQYPGRKFEKGNKFGMETRFKKGELSPGWKGGISESNYKNNIYNKLRLEREIKAGGSHTKIEWEKLKKSNKFTCPCCKKSEPEIKLGKDHIIPISKYGSDNIENIQPLCLKCNRKKYTKIIRY